MSKSGDEIELRNLKTEDYEKKAEEEAKTYSKHYQVVATISVACVSIINGFVSGYTSTIKDSLTESLHIDDNQYTWIGSLVALGGLVGGLVAGSSIDLIGRKTTVLMTNLMFVVSWLCIVTASNVWFLYVSRAIAGIAMGIMSLAIQVYLGETLQPDVRGALGLFPTAFGNIGILTCMTAGMFLNWRGLAWFGLILPIPFLILYFFIPETPRYYINNNKEEKAAKSLEWLRNSKHVSEELRQLKESVSKQENKINVDFGAFKERANLLPLFVALGLMFFQQMSGITAVIYYTLPIFKVSGSSINPNICTIIVGTVNFVSVFIATSVIDRLGRKLLLYTSALTMVVTLTLLGIFFYVKETKGTLGSIGWMPLAAFIIYVLGFSLGFGPIPWLMLGEVFPVRVRGLAGSIVTAFHWTCSFVVTKTFLMVVDAIHTSGTFWLFAVMCGFAIIFTYCFVKETRNKTLEEIEREFAGGEHA